MNRTSYLTWILLLSVVLLALLTSSCSREQTPSITIATGGVGGNYEVVGRAIARTVNQNLGAHVFRLDDEISAGSAANIDAILSGNVEFGMAQADQQYQALNGMAQWSDKGPQTDLRAVFSLYAEAVTLIVGADSGIKTVNDLRGRHVDIGLPGSGTRQNAIDALSAAGIDWQTDIQAQQEALDVRLAKLMHNEIDAYFFTVGHPSRDVKFATFSVRGVRFVPLANIDKILSSTPYYSIAVVPVDIYPRADNTQDTETIGVKSLLLTSADVPDDVVYALTKVVFENLDSLREDHPVLAGLRQEDMLEGFTAPIHPGALRYYREAGIDFPDQ